MDYKSILNNFRGSITEIDMQILDLFAQRFQISQAIGQIKKENNLPLLDESRWKELLGELKHNASLNGLDETFVEDVWNRVHRESLSIQK